MRFAGQRAQGLDLESDPEAMGVQAWEGEKAIEVSSASAEAQAVGGIKGEPGNQADVDPGGIHFGAKGGIGLEGAQWGGDQLCFRTSDDVTRHGLRSGLNPRIHPGGLCKAMTKGGEIGFGGQRGVDEHDAWPLQSRVDGEAIDDFPGGAGTFRRRDRSEQRAHLAPGLPLAACHSGGSHGR